MNGSAHESPTPLHSLTLRNILSFGPDAQTIPLGPLNVLIGPNGSGKSNLIEAIALLRATPGDLRAVTREGGGVREWIWKGAPRQIAEITAVIDDLSNHFNLQHIVAFRTSIMSFKVVREQLNVTAHGAGSAVRGWLRRDSGRRGR